MTTLTYAGIGARATPSSVLAHMPWNFDSLSS